LKDIGNNKVSILELVKKKYMPKNKKFKESFRSPLTEVSWMYEDGEPVAYKEKGKVTKVKFPSKLDKVR